jgi:hypothetical protein
MGIERIHVGSYEVLLFSGQLAIGGHAGSNSYNPQSKTRRGDDRAGFTNLERADLYRFPCCAARENSRNFSTIYCKTDNHPALWARV